MTSVRRFASLVVLSCAACMSSDDARNAIDAVRSNDMPDVLPIVQNAELPFQYPLELYERKVQADVTLRLYIDSLGRVWPESTMVAGSSGYAGLDSAAVTGSRALRFAPARRDGAPMGVSVLFPILFRHPDAPPLPEDTMLRRK